MDIFELNLCGRLCDKKLKTTDLATNLPVLAVKQKAAGRYQIWQVNIPVLACGAALWLH